MSTVSIKSGIVGGGEGWQQGQSDGLSCGKVFQHLFYDSPTPDSTVGTLFLAVADPPTAIDAGDGES